MSAPLLTTKLYVPRPRPGLVARPRLTQRLEAGARAGHRLTLVSAPAGFGKTTLVAEWLQAWDETGASPLAVRADADRSGRRHPCATQRRAVAGGTPPARVAWVSLDEGDNDPVRFFGYLIAALRTLGEDVGQATQSLLGGPHVPPVESLMTLLVNDVAAWLASLPAHPGPGFVLVLDDYHLIRTPLIHDALTFLLAHQPPRMHLVIATRKDPPLPLPRLRVRDQMTEIRAADLRFTVEEATAFLNQALGTSLESELVAALEARTEGWIAGLQMASLSMQGSGHPDHDPRQARERVADFVAAFSGSNRHVIDYLAEEVLSQQAEADRDFLRQVAVLDRLSAPLCDAVTGRDDSDAVLQRLERANLFLVPLDAERRWYRYHRLFADFLRTELDPQNASALHLKAAHWFEAQHLLPEAVAHVLASGDDEEAARIVTDACGQALVEGALTTLLGWLDALPDEVVRADPDLATMKAWGLSATGQVEAGMSYARSAEAALPADGDPIRRGRLLSLRCYAAETHEVLELAQEALDLLGDADPPSRSITLFMLGDAQDAVGNVAEAIRAFRQALHLEQRYDNLLIAAVAAGHLAFSLNAQGRRREAVALCTEAIQRHVDARGNPLPLAGLLLVALGTLEYEANELAQARGHLEQGLTLGQQSATMRIVLCSLEALALLQCATGEMDQALATIQEAERLASQAGERLWHRTSEALKADLQLIQGNRVAAERWAAGLDVQAGALADEPRDTARKFEYPVRVRLLLAQARPEEALDLLARLERSAARGDRQRELITIHIQQALAAALLGRRTNALDYLDRAVRLAAPEGYVRAFLDEALWERGFPDAGFPGEGPALVHLLRQAAAQGVEPSYVGRLLAAFDGETGHGRAARDPILPDTLPLLEPLTEREMQVLRLMAADLSAPEIAEEFVIAVSTVRSHIKNIYGKLGAHSRYEAVERASALHLL